MADRRGGRHLDPRPRPPGQLRERLTRHWWLGWAAATGLYAWLAYRVAELGLPHAVVLFTALVAGLAFTAGHVRGSRDTD